MANTYKAKKIPNNEKFSEVLQMHYQNKVNAEPDIADRLYAYNKIYEKKKKNLEKQLYSSTH